MKREGNHSPSSGQRRDFGDTDLVLEIQQMRHKEGVVSRARKFADGIELTIIAY